MTGAKGWCKDIRRVNFVCETIEHKTCVLRMMGIAQADTGGDTGQHHPQNDRQVKGRKY